MQDGSDAVSDWPLLNALLNTASGATWVSIHHGGGVGMGFSQHAGMVIVCDGTEAAAKRIGRVLWNDPATGVMRHADAGYEIAIECGARAWPQPPEPRVGAARREHLPQHIGGGCHFATGLAIVLPEIGLPTFRYMKRAVRSINTL